MAAARNLRQPHIYVRKGADPAKAPRAGAAEVFLSKPGHHVHALGKVFIAQV